MSIEEPEVGAEQPEADAVDQATPAHPDDLRDGLPEAPGPEGLVSESDWVDQQREVSLPEDGPDTGFDDA